MATILTLDPSAPPTDGQILVYDAASKKWLPQAAPTGDVSQAELDAEAAARDAADAALDVRVGDLESAPGGGGAVDSVNGETGTVVLSAADVGAQPAGSYAAALGGDDNYVTDAEKVKLGNLSGTNTGDQTLPTWTTIAGKPAVVAAGATQADARTAIGAGTSSLALGTTGSTAAAGNDSRLSDPRTPTAHTHVATTDLTATGMKDATTFLRGDNTWAVPAGGGGSDPWTYVIATADTSNSTTTPANAAGLTVSSLPDGLYELEVMVLGESSAFATGVQVGLTWGASAPVAAQILGQGGAVTTTAYLVTSTGATSGVVLGTSTPGSNILFLAARMTGLVRAASMTHDISVTVNSETAATNVKVKADSFIRYRRIAN